MQNDLRVRCRALRESPAQTSAPLHPNIRATSPRRRCVVAADVIVINTPLGSTELRTDGDRACWATGSDGKPVWIEATCGPASAFEATQR